MKHGRLVETISTGIFSHFFVVGRYRHLSWVAVRRRKLSDPYGPCGQQKCSCRWGVDSCEFSPSYVKGVCWKGFWETPSVMYVQFWSWNFWEAISNRTYGHLGLLHIILDILPIQYGVIRYCVVFKMFTAFWPWWTSSWLLGCLSWVFSETPSSFNGHFPHDPAKIETPKFSGSLSSGGHQSFQKKILSKRRPEGPHLLRKAVTLTTRGRALCPGTNGSGGKPDWRIGWKMSGFWSDSTLPNQFGFDNAFLPAFLL